METTKYVNVAFKAYANTTLYSCDIEDIKVGDFVIVPSWTGELTGRVMSFTKTKSSLGKKTQLVLRRATPEEINEVADVFGIPKDPKLTDEDDESFLTNSGYGTKELNKIMKKYQKKQAANAEKLEADENVKVEKQKVQNLTSSAVKDDAGLPSFWRYVAVGILALYFYFNYC